MGAGVDYLFIGDDFTGASDTLATLARTGRRVRLFLEPPDPGRIADEGFDAIGIATEFRSLPAAAVTARIEALTPVLKALAPRVVHYKVCSTFDSSPETGSIGAAVAALERDLAPALLAVVGGQPSLGRYCAFGNLFARGADGEVHRIDRHPVMRNHPITPMTEADLRVHLARQGLDPLRLISRPEIMEGVPRLRERLADLIRGGERRLLFDACDQTDIETIGAVLGGPRGEARPLLAVGASSIAEALGGDLRPGDGDRPARDERKAGPCLVVAGSRSEVTAAQVEAARGFHRLPIGPRDLEDATATDRLAARAAAALARTEDVLAHLEPSTDYGVSGAALSHKLADLVSLILDRQAVCALGIAGGDTSSIVVRRLGFHSLSFEERLDAGVAICRAHSDATQRDGMRLMLKGGQVGSEGVFERFVSATGKRSPAIPAGR
ncbi:four-carbon acid sugar kinase family protein [Chelativorans sp. M5D2P16]|uniref:four-carbon acid sugar kinase family protein n=1 Tax=Chelativorans sp. M5D2P16 TaxID=3095678 RepID=UPI002ACAB06B|nr:four-carbon acid sugar kinase family protein [Chelativorans sp. M5D2P16]MDZ5699630.1 four-carbon acid sugar kinase family protein [Chelativorans sp. M5D2P16]